MDFCTSSFLCASSLSRKWCPYFHFPALFLQKLPIHPSESSESFSMKSFLIPSQTETLCSFLSFLFFFELLFIFGCVGLCCCVQAFSSWSEQELLSSCNAQAFHCGAFSCCRAQAVGEWVSVVRVHKLSCPMGTQYLSSQTRSWTHVPCIDRWAFNHWTIRKILFALSNCSCLCYLGLVSFCLVSQVCRFTHQLCARQWSTFPLPPPKTENAIWENIIVK